MSNAWYPRYTGDFIRDTSHLSLVEVGAYNRILDHYYASSGPLCMTEAQVMRLCAAVTPEECEAVKYVLSAYFVFEPEDGCYHNPRADKELLSMADHHKRLSDAGKRGNEIRWKAGDREAIARRSPGDSEANREGIAYPQSQSQPQPESQSQPDKELFARSRNKSGSKPPPPPSENSVIFIPLSEVNKETGTKYQHGVTPDDVALWEDSFPAVDVMQTLREIRAWCLANPLKCKTSRGIQRFLTSWMHREQNKGAGRGR